MKTKNDQPARAYLGVAVAYGESHVYSSDSSAIQALSASEGEEFRLIDLDEYLRLQGMRSWSAADAQVSSLFSSTITYEEFNSPESNACSRVPTMIKVGYLPCLSWVESRVVQREIVFEGQRYAVDPHLVDGAQRYAGGLPKPMPAKQWWTHYRTEPASCYMQCVAGANNKGSLAGAMLQICEAFELPQTVVFAIKVITFMCKAARHPAKYLRGYAWEVLNRPMGVIDSIINAYLATTYGVIPAADQVQWARTEFIRGLENWRSWACNLSLIADEGVNAANEHNAKLRQLIETFRDRWREEDALRVQRSFDAAVRRTQQQQAYAQLKSKLKDARAADIAAAKLRRSLRKTEAYEEYLRLKADTYDADIRIDELRRQRQSIFDRKAYLRAALEVAQETADAYRALEESARWLYISDPNLYREGWYGPTIDWPAVTRMQKDYREKISRAQSLARSIATEEMPRLDSELRTKQDEINKAYLDAIEAQGERQRLLDELRARRDSISLEYERAYYDAQRRYDSSFKRSTRKSPPRTEEERRAEALERARARSDRRNEIIRDIMSRMRPSAGTIRRSTIPKQGLGKHYATPDGELEHSPGDPNVGAVPTSVTLVRRWRNGVWLDPPHHEQFVSWCAEHFCYEVRPVVLYDVVYSRFEGDYREFLGTWEDMTRAFMDLVDPVGNLWAITPLSFVVDWFTGVAPMLDRWVLGLQSFYRNPVKLLDGVWRSRIWGFQYALGAWNNVSVERSIVIDEMITLPDGSQAVGAYRVEQTYHGNVTPEWRACWGNLFRRERYKPTLAEIALPRPGDVLNVPEVINPNSWNLSKLASFVALGIQRS